MGLKLTSIVKEEYTHYKSKEERKIQKEIEKLQAKQEKLIGTHTALKLEKIYEAVLSKCTNTYFISYAEYLNKDLIKNALSNTFRFLRFSWKDNSTLCWCEYEEEEEKPNEDFLDSFVDSISVGSETNAENE